MKLPEATRSRNFRRCETRYPIKRSALIPMLLYGQDEFGFVSDELIEEIAARLDLNTLQVDRNAGVLLHAASQAAGKYHVQVCTNVSCMLRGGNKILEHVERKLEIGHKEVTKDGMFSLEEVECIGACTGAPAMQVNYDFYENLTPETVDQIIDGLDRGTKARARAANFGLGARAASRRSRR